MVHIANALKSRDALSDRYCLFAQITTLFSVKVVTVERRLKVSDFLSVGETSYSEFVHSGWNQQR